MTPTETITLIRWCLVLITAATGAAIFYLVFTLVRTRRETRRRRTAAYRAARKQLDRDLLGDRR